MIRSMPFDPPLVILDDARPGMNGAFGGARRFSRAHGAIIAETPVEVPGALEALAAAQRAGHHLAGYFSYELGFVLEPKLAPLLPAVRPAPLLWFGIFDAPEQTSTAALAAAVRGRAYAGPLRHEWDEAAYAARFVRARDWIAAGDIYQANLSFRSRFTFQGDPLALYLALREQAAAAYCAYIDDGARRILSLSPELFFELSADRRITARPMKGTAARGADDSADAAARRRLALSEKDRAENLMIVDLLRNDLGRIAEIGSVSARELFAVETYPTLHAMVSTVTAKLKPGTGIAAILKALFPCGSITGAPKIRAMEIIAALEQSPRGVYCGAIGHFAPDGTAAFNVAIRTLTLSGNRGELGIGGAVVHDSRAADEYAECLLKARYYETARQPLELIETLRYAPGEGFTRLERHLARLAHSAAAFAMPFDRARALAALAARVAGTVEPQRVRLVLDEQGNLSVTAAALGAPPARWRYAISPARVLSSDLLQQHKTSRRGLYEAEHARLAQATGCDEVIFLNERDEIAEASRSNLFVKIGDALVTPPLSAGALDGCLRRELIETGQCTERTLTADDLARADAAWFGNSLRGLIPVVAL